LNVILAVSISTFLNSESLVRGVKFGYPFKMCDFCYGPLIKRENGSRQTAANRNKH